MTSGPTALEREANAPQPKRFRLSEPDVRYCIYMMEKYGEDYKVSLLCLVNKLHAFLYTFWIFKMQLMLNFKELYLRMIFHNVVFCEVNPSFNFYLEHDHSCTVNYSGVRSSVVSLNELFQRLVNLCSDKLIRRNLVWSVIAGTNILFFERNTFDYWITKVSVLMIDIGQNYVRIES